MDNGQYRQNPTNQELFANGITPGVGTMPENASLSDQPNLESDTFLADQDYSGRGNTVLQSSNELTPLIPLPDSIPNPAAATTSHGPEISAANYPISPEVKLGEIQDVPTPPSVSTSETPIPDSIESAVKPFLDGKASSKDVNMLKSKIDDLMRDGENPNKAATLVDLWDASREAMNAAGGSK